MGHNITITKMDHDRTPRFSYPGELEATDDSMMVVRCVWLAPKPFEVGEFRLDLGDIFIEYYYRHEWFNIFEVRAPTGALKGWYCNITAPAEIEQDAIRWYDLALDLLVLPNGEQILLDEDEFEALHPDESLRAQAAAAVAKLRRWATKAHPPFGDLSHPSSRDIKAG